MRAEAPMRVGYVVKRYPRFSETFIVNEVLAHEAAGLPVEVFSLYPPNDTHFQDSISRVRAPVTYLSSEGLRAVDFWAAIDACATEVPHLWQALSRGTGSDARTVFQGALLAREAVRRGLTHLHAHFATAPAEVARLAAAFARIPYTVTAHAKDIYHESVSLPRLRRVLGDAAGVVTVSDFNVAYLVEHVGLDPARVHRIYNGLDLDRFSATPGATRAPRVVSVGRFVPKKGLDDLVRACALLRDRDMAFDCVLVGGGPEEARLRAMVAESGLERQVTFAGPLPQRDMIEVVRGAAVFAAPCIVAGDGDRDGLPTVLLEAMALGTPVVSTDVVGIPEVVRDGDTGLLVPERHPERLAAALARLLASNDLQQVLGRRARGLIEREFDVRENAATQRGLFATAARARIARAS